MVLDVGWLTHFPNNERGKVVYAKPVGPLEFSMGAPYRQDVVRSALI
jgi:hypothetical protein